MGRKAGRARNALKNSQLIWRQPDKLPLISGGCFSAKRKGELFDTMSQGESRGQFEHFKNVVPKDFFLGIG